MGKPGKREFVQVLRLLEVFRPDDVLAGVREAIARGVIGFDAAYEACQKKAARVSSLSLVRYRGNDGLRSYSLPAAGHGNDHLALGLPETAGGRSSVMSDTPQVLLAHHLKALRLPTFLREYDKLARQCAAEASITRATCCVWPSWR